MTDLARRLVVEGALVGKWRFMDGMLLVNDDGQSVRITWRDHLKTWQLNGRCAPDLADPATVGCLLAMLWEVAPMTEIDIGPDHGSDGPVWWEVWAAPIKARGKGRTPGEAIAAALLDAWGGSDV